MAILPTNYLDDILATSMGGKRKFRITHQNGASEEVTIEDVSEYEQVGSMFGAGDINGTNSAVNEKVNRDDIVDPTLATEEGFPADAKKTGDALSELNKNMYWNAGESYTFDGLHTGGFVTSTKTQIYFVIPLSKPVTASNVKIDLEFIVRQNGKYIFGQAYEQPTSVSAFIKEGYIDVIATVPTMSDAINNSECGIAARGTVEFT